MKHRINKAKRLSNRRRDAKANVSFEKMEPRNLMATFGVVTLDGVTTLELRGTAQPDTINVSQTGQQLIAKINDQTRVYPSADIDRVLAYGFDGDDVITNDTNKPSLLAGQHGDDTITGGSAADTIYGQWDSDILDGRGGNDTVADFEGVNIIRGGAGNDKLYGGSGPDQIFGGEGADRLIGKAGNDRLYPEAGGVVGGQEYAAGGTGDDIFYGGYGLNTYRGELGDDTYIIQNSGSTAYGYDRVIEGNNQGFDRIDASAVTVTDVTTNNGTTTARYGVDRRIIVVAPSTNVEVIPAAEDAPTDLRLELTQASGTNQFVSQFKIIVPAFQGSEIPGGNVSDNGGRLWIYDSGAADSIMPVGTPQITNAGVTYTYQVSQGGLFQKEYRVIVPEGTFGRGGHVNPQYLLTARLGAPQFEVSHNPSDRGDRFTLSLVPLQNGKYVDVVFTPAATEYLSWNNLTLTFNNVPNGSQEFLQPVNIFAPATTISDNRIIFRYYVGGVANLVNNIPNDYRVFFGEGAWDFRDAWAGQDAPISDSAAIIRFWDRSQGRFVRP